jgi:hypothetical protein
VHDADPVAVLQRGQHTGDDVQGGVDVEVVALGQDVAQGPALDVFHHDVRQVEDADGRVVQCGRGLGLPPESGLERRVPSQIGAQQLDRDGTPETGVAAQMYLGHPATAEQLPDLVAVAKHPRAVVHQFHPSVVVPVVPSIRSYGSIIHRPR